MGRAERVVLALGALGEAGEAAALAQGADAIAPAGQDLVRVGLVADVPDNPIARRVEHVMQGDGELDDTQARTEMPPGHRYCVDRLGPQLVRDLLEFFFGKLAEIFGVRNGVEERGRDGQGTILVRRIAATADRRLVCT